MQLVFVVTVRRRCFFRDVVFLREAREAFSGEKGIAERNGKACFHKRYKRMRTVGMLQSSLVNSGPSDYKNVLDSSCLATAPRQCLLKCADRDRISCAIFTWLDRE